MVIWHRAKGEKNVKQGFPAEFHVMKAPLAVELGTMMQSDVQLMQSRLNFYDSQHKWPIVIVMVCFRVGCGVCLCA